MHILTWLTMMVQSGDGPTFQRNIGFWNFDIGNVSIVVGLVLQGLILYANSNRQHGENKQKIAELVKWKHEHDMDSRQRDEAISELRGIAASMKATAESMNSQLQVMREDLRELRRKRA